MANNSYARGIALTLANDVIGTGPRLQMLTDEAKANRQIEAEFAAWAKGSPSSCQGLTTPAVFVASLLYSSRKGGFELMWVLPVVWRLK